VGGCLCQIPVTSSIILAGVWPNVKVGRGEKEVGEKVGVIEMVLLGKTEMGVAGCPGGCRKRGKGEKKAKAEATREVSGQCPTILHRWGGKSSKGGENHWKPRLGGEAEFCWGGGGESAGESTRIKRWQELWGVWGGFFFVCGVVFFSGANENWD